MVPCVCFCITAAHFRVKGFNFTHGEKAQFPKILELDSARRMTPVQRCHYTGDLPNTFAASGRKGGIAQSRGQVWPIVPPVGEIGPDTLHCSIGRTTFDMQPHAKKDVPA